MTGPFKIAAMGIVVTFFVMAQAFCACAVVMSPAPMDQLSSHHAVENDSHHGHNMALDASGSDEIPCQHCEQGMDEATPSASVATLLTPSFQIETVTASDRMGVTSAQIRTPKKSLDHRSWLDPPPTQAVTPISLKTRLLT